MKGTAKNFKSLYWGRLHLIEGTENILDGPMSFTNTFISTTMPLMKRVIL